MIWLNLDNVNMAMFFVPMFRHNTMYIVITGVCSHVYYKGNSAIKKKKKKKNSYTV